MPLKNNLIVKNNLIAIAIHACICLVFIIPIGYIWRWDGVWHGTWSSMSVIFNWLAIGVYTFIALLLYFGSGKQFLCNTYNMQKNVFSVMALVIIVVILFTYDSGMWPLKLPFYPIAETISYFLQIEEKYAFLIMSILPSLTMLAGMMTKRKESHLPLNESES